MEKKMEKEKYIMMMVEFYFLVNISMDKKMEKEKNILEMVN